MAFASKSCPFIVPVIGVEAAFAFGAGALLGPASFTDAAAGAAVSVSGSSVSVSSVSVSAGDSDPSGSVIAAALLFRDVSAA